MTDVGVIADMLGVAFGLCERGLGLFKRSATQSQSIGVSLNGVAYATTPREIVVQNNLPADIPEPGILGLLSLGLAGFGLSRRRKA
jgi:hypothetical protein